MQKCLSVILLGLAVACSGGVGGNLTGPTGGTTPPSSKVIAIPDTWTIQHGVYAGKTVTVPKSALFALAGKNDPTSFYQLVSGTQKLRAWGKTNPFPIPFYINHVGSAAISAADSMMVVHGISELNRIVGQTIYVVASDGPASFVLGDVSGPPHGYSWWNDAGDITSAEIFFPSQLVFTEGQLVVDHVIEHEAFHTLGFGHTCAFLSAMASSVEIQSTDGSDCSSMLSSGLSIMDVALFEMAYWLRDQVAATGGTYSFTS